MLIGTERSGQRSGLDAEDLLRVQRNGPQGKGIGGAALCVLTLSAASRLASVGSVVERGAGFVSQRGRPPGRASKGRGRQAALHAGSENAGGPPCSRAREDPGHEALQVRIRNVVRRLGIAPHTPPPLPPAFTFALQLRLRRCVALSSRSRRTTGRPRLSGEWQALQLYSHRAPCRRPGRPTSDERSGNAERDDSFHGNSS